MDLWFVEDFTSLLRLGCFHQIITDHNKPVDKHYLCLDGLGVPASCVLLTSKHPEIKREGCFWKT